MRALAHPHDATSRRQVGRRVEQEPLAERARPLLRARPEERRRRAAVGACEQHGARVRAHGSQRRQQRRARRPYAVVKPSTSSPQAAGELGSLQRREQREGEEEGEVEDRMPVVRDLRVQHPRAVGPEQDVLGRVVAVHEAGARVAQLGDERRRARPRGGGAAASRLRDTARGAAARRPRSRRTPPRRRHRPPSRRAGGRACRRPSGRTPRARGRRAARPASCASRAGACCSTTTCSRASLSTTGGTRPGIRRAASRSAAASVSVRRAGAIHSLGHPQPRQRLLDDQRDARPAHGEHGARDAARQLLDGQLDVARHQAARDEVVGDRAGLERHGGGSAGVQSSRSPAWRVASIASFAIVPSRSSGSARSARMPGNTCRSRSKCTRVATAWATAASSQGSTSASTTVTSLTRLTASSAASAAVRASPGSWAAERDDGGEPPGAALGHRDGLHRRHDAAAACARGPRRSRRRRAARARGGSPAEWPGRARRGGASGSGTSPSRRGRSARSRRGTPRRGPPRRLRRDRARPPARSRTRPAPRAGPAGSARARRARPAAHRRRAARPRRARGRGRPRPAAPGDCRSSPRSAGARRARARRAQPPRDGGWGRCRPAPASRRAAARARSTSCARPSRGRAPRCSRR